MTTSVVDAVATHAKARPAVLACADLDSGLRWNYGEFDRVINQTAHWLISKLGKRSGARVATLSRNRGEILILNFACERAGAIFVPLNWRLSVAEVKALADDADIALLFYDTDFSLPDLSVDSFELCVLTQLVADESHAPVIGSRRDFDEPSILLYTSGTSGSPKGVILTAANVFWGNINFNLGNGVSQHSVFLCDMPLFHTAGLLANARSPLLAGGSLLISSGFNADKTLARIADPELAITHYFSVPQMAQMLWNNPQFTPEKLQGLHVYATGGAPNPAAQIERFVNAGIPMSDGFGMTETGSNFGMPVSNSALLIEKSGSCGLPYISLEVRLVDSDGNPVAVNEPGEMLLRGPSISPGYWNKPEQTELAFQDGWFYSGDIARVDEDGFYYIVDRKKDMYISGGENVYPVEVEATIARLNTVAEVAVVGVPDDTWGEKGVAFIVVVKVDDLMTEDRVREHCELHLAKYKVPKNIVLVDEIPRTGSGKVIKSLLVEQAKTL